MSKTWSTGVVVLVSALGLLGSQAWAQSAKVDVPFSFMVAKKELPAGSYELRIDGGEMKRVVVRNLATGESTQSAVLFRLADMGVAEPSLAFDVNSGAHYLSEIHFPHMDGFALAGAPSGEHKHEMVRAKP